ncbi:MAG TPA: GNAT family N-acetyltransferase [Bacilli bacterium]|nr:GNAT family N-acetyltransferase [Bacilli bacterium]
MSKIRTGQNEFYIENEKRERIAEITFFDKDSETIVIDHTFVSEILRGQGIARQLVDSVVAYARKNNKKIIPECSYAYKVLVNAEEFKDVLKKD